jgi:hypothetical protein
LIAPIKLMKRTVQVRSMMQKILLSEQNKKHPRHSAIYHTSHKPQLLKHNRVSISILFYYYNT